MLGEALQLFVLVNYQNTISYTVSYSGGLDLTSRIIHSGYRPFGHFCLFDKEIGTFERDVRVDLRLSAMPPSP
jgi:hypothetical protein